MTLLEKMLKITEEMPILEKDGKHTQFSYPTDANITRNVKRLLIKHRIFFSATCLSALAENGNIVRVTMKYRLEDIDSKEVHEAVFVGDGADKGDKAVSKAITGARKAFFGNTFLLESSDDPEKEEPKPKRTVDKSPEFDQAPRVSNPWVWAVEGMPWVDNAIKGKRYCDVAIGTVKKATDPKFKGAFSKNDIVFAKLAIQKPELRKVALEPPMSDDYVTFETDNQSGDE